MKEKPIKKATPETFASNAMIAMLRVRRDSGIIKIEKANQWVGNVGNAEKDEWRTIQFKPDSKLGDENNNN